MKLHIKIVLPVIAILLLLFLLVGCLPGLAPPPSPKGVISGRVMVPGSEAAKDITGWVPVANATAEEIINPPAPPSPPPTPVTKTVINTVTLDYTEGGPVSANCSTTVTY